MKRKVFISFRFSDGAQYKKELSDKFDEETKVINCSEDIDRSGCTEERRGSSCRPCSRSGRRWWPRA